MPRLASKKRTRTWGPVGRGVTGWRFGTFALGRAYFLAERCRARIAPKKEQCYGRPHGLGGGGDAVRNPAHGDRHVWILSGFEIADRGTAGGTCAGSKCSHGTGVVAGGALTAGRNFAGGGRGWVRHPLLLGRRAGAPRPG